MFSDVYTGGYFHSGVEYWPASWRTPIARAIQQASQARYVLLTGLADNLFPSVRMAYAQFRQAGFKSATYMEVPDLRHTYPSAEWFEKGLVILDGPLAKKKK